MGFEYRRILIHTREPCLAALLFCFILYNEFKWTEHCSLSPKVNASRRLQVMRQNIYDDPTFFEYYKELRSTGITFNDFVEQPALKALLPDLKGLTVLDMGCGFGKLASYMVEQGAAHVTGADISSKMLSIAPKLPEITYIHAPIEELNFEAESFDLIVSSLAFHYVADYDRLMAQIAKWLRSGGTLVFSTEHPITTAKLDMEGWVEDEHGERLHYAIDNYGEEGQRSTHWVVDNVIKYHRKVSTLVNGMIAHDLIVQHIDEPESIPEGLEKMPKLTQERRKPSFILFKAVKK